MKIQIRLFAHQAEKAGLAASALDVADGATVADAVNLLRKEHPDIPWPPGTLVAVNQQYATMTTTLQPNDELAIIPPVSGG